MEVMQHLREKVEKKKQVISDFQEGVEEVIEEALVGRRPRRSKNTDDSDTTADDVAVDIDTSKMKGSGGEELAQIDKSNNSVYFSNNEGTTVEWSHLEKNVKVEDLGAKLKDVDIQKVLNAVINGKNVENLNDNLPSGSSLTPSTKPKEEDEHLQTGIVNESDDEEVIELEFERAAEKMHTHQYNMYCPNCSNKITKVVLRRKIKRKTVPASSDGRRQEKPMDLLGCLSCFSIFIPSGNRLNPLRIFGRHKEREPFSQQQQTSDVNSSTLQQHASDASLPTSSSKKDTGNCFDMFRLFGKPRVNQKDSDFEQASAPGGGQSRNLNEASAQYSIDNAILHGKSTLVMASTNGAAIVASAGNLSQTSDPEGSIINGNVIIDINEQLDGKIQWVKHPVKPESEIKGGENITTNQNGGVDVQIPVEGDILTETSQGTNNVTETNSPVIVTEAQNSKSLEIVRAIVYGGLMESITSLSVVSSAAASDATTLNIVALGLANLIGGLVVLGHNLKDLRDGESNQTNQQVTRYQELLGRRENFLLHAVVAVLAYLVFGLIPPVIYGFTYRESADKDFKLLAVAAASLLCIVILAIAKAYTRGQHKLMEYFKTVLYYVSSAVMVSGIAYAVGDLLQKLMERLGWFDSKPVEALLIPETKPFSPSWATY